MRVQDEEVVRLARAYEAAYSAFVSTHWRSLLRAAFLIAGNQSAAEDVLQSALLRLYEAWPRLDVTEPPLGYVRRILYTTHVSAWRRTWREVPHDVVPDDRVSADPYQQVHDRDVLWRLVERLPYMQRAVVLLRYYEDLDEATIASTLGISTGSVKTHLSRAMRKLRDAETAGRVAGRKAL